jgi:hypothetical protein
LISKQYVSEWHNLPIWLEVLLILFRFYSIGFDGAKGSDVKSQVTVLTFLRWLLIFFLGLLEKLEMRLATEDSSFSEHQSGALKACAVLRRVSL